MPVRQAIVESGQAPVIRAIGATYVDVVIAILVLAIVNHPLSVRRPLNPLPLNSKKLHANPGIRDWPIQQ